MDAEVIAVSSLKVSRRHQIQRYKDKRRQLGEKQPRLTDRPCGLTHTLSLNCLLPKRYLSRDGSSKSSRRALSSYPRVMFT
ncbi:hypothetical protein F2P79_011895 [Pimephales promelas]|nr:hypothetical protein F2P79_011895 [Pimephales promelas]